MEHMVLGVLGVSLSLNIVSFIISFLAFRKAGIDWRSLDQWEVESKGRLVHAGNEEYERRLKVFDERLDEAHKIRDQVNGLIGRATRTARQLGMDENGEPAQRFPLPSEVVNIQPTAPANNGTGSGLKRQFDR